MGSAYQAPLSMGFPRSQARILERVAISFSGGSSQPRDWTCISCLAGRFFPTEPPRKPRLKNSYFFSPLSIYYNMPGILYKYLKACSSFARWSENTHFAEEETLGVEGWNNLLTKATSEGSHGAVVWIQTCRIQVLSTFHKMRTGPKCIFFLLHFVPV